MSRLYTFNCERKGFFDNALEFGSFRTNANRRQPVIAVDTLWPRNWRLRVSYRRAAPTLINRANVICKESLPPKRALDDVSTSCPKRRPADGYASKTQNKSGVTPFPARDLSGDFSAREPMGTVRAHRRSHSESEYVRAATSSSSDLATDSSGTQLVGSSVVAARGSNWGQVGSAPRSGARWGFLVRSGTSSKGARDRARRAASPGCIANSPLEEGGGRGGGPPYTPQSKHHCERSPEKAKAGDASRRQSHLPAFQGTASVP